MKHSLPLALFLIAAPALAGPTLLADPYPATGPQPASLSLSVNGATGPACTLAPGTAGALIPTCDLVTLAVPGVYTLVLTANFVAGCVNSANAATCTNGGSAASVPFILTRRVAPATGPALSVSP